MMPRWSKTYRKRSNTKLRIAVTTGGGREETGEYKKQHITAYNVPDMVMFIS